MKCYYYSHFLFLVPCLFVLCFRSSANGRNISNQNSTVQCLREERDALLEFKQGIQADHCGFLTSWTGQECCQWYGVSCSNYSSHVIGLHLSGYPYHYQTFYDSCLEGIVSPSLTELKHLQHLDLSSNSFHGQPIPNFIGSLVNLEHLNLSSASFEGEIPHQLANLSSLTSLDLGHNIGVGLNATNLGWLSHLTLLREIDLSWINLTQATDWMQIVNNLPFLRSLGMNGCNLPLPTSSSLEYRNSSTTLRFLSLSGNDFNDSAIFPWIFNLTGSSSSLVHLDLSGNEFHGSIPSGLGSMYSLSHLDLSQNGFEGPFPESFSNLKHLAYLDLSSNNFHSIPSGLGSMYSLSLLDLSENGLEGPFPESFSNLKHLAYLDLSSNNFHSIPSGLGSMYSLSHLDLSQNGLEGPFPESFSNLKHLAYLDLSSNNFQGDRLNLEMLGSLCGLQELGLSYNKLSGELSTILRPLSHGCAHKSIVSLGLSLNNLWGSILDEVCKFISLRGLDLSSNQLNGTVSPCLGQLSMLESLSLRNNSLKGTFSEHHLSNLSRLTALDLSVNPQLVVNIDENWTPPFQLDVIYLASTKLGPDFPKWLLTQNNFSALDISNTGISDTVPLSFWDSLPSNMESMDMSGNRIHGNIPSVSVSFQNLNEIDLSSNAFSGAIPTFLANASSLWLNDNKFSDMIPLFSPKAKAALSFVDISNNSLSGELPNNWSHFDQLVTLRLENNNLSGELPHSIGLIPQLQALQLRNNSFSGELPASFQNRTSFVIMDLSYNSLTGQLSHWIGNLINLVELSLRSNKFVGGLPSGLCQLSNLQSLDLSHNFLSGSIPKCIYNLTAMRETTLNSWESYGRLLIWYRSSDGIGETGFNDFAWIMWKGKEWNVGDLKRFRAIDISSNELEGPIPDGISSLIGLTSLNLSSNRLNGSIKPQVGQLASLEALDLSSNQLCGEVPASLNNLDSLGILDLSNNNLSGKIPVGNHLETFDASSYSGNPGLCGNPLPPCPGDQPPTHAPKKEGKNKEDEDWIFPGLYISVLLGFIVGFWGVCGSLVIKQSWREAYFRFVEDMVDKLYVWFVVDILRAWRRT